MDSVINYIISGCEVSQDILVLIRLCLITSVLQMIGNLMSSFRRLYR